MDNCRGQVVIDVDVCVVREPGDRPPFMTSWPANEERANPGENFRSADERVSHYYYNAIRPRSKEFVDTSIVRAKRVICIRVKVTGKRRTRQRP